MKAETVALAIALWMIPVLTFGAGSNEPECDSESDLNTVRVTYYNVEEELQEWLDEGYTILLCISNEIPNPKTLSLDTTRVVVEVKMRKSNGYLKGSFGLYREARAPFGKWNISSDFEPRIGHLPDGVSSIKEIVIEAARVIEVDPRSMLYRYRVVTRQRV